MDIMALLTWAAGYIVLASIIFNLLKYGFGANLASTIILSAILPFLIFRIEWTGPLGDFLSEYIFALIICGATIGSVIAITRSGKLNNSKGNTKSQQ